MRVSGKGALFSIKMMEKYKEVLKDPIGIAISVVHLMLISFILFNDGIYQFKTAISPFRGVIVPHALDSYSTNLILDSNIIPYIFVKAISKTIGLYFEKNIFLDCFVFLIFFVISSLQWLIVGYVIGELIKSNAKIEKTFSLKTNKY